VPLEDVPLSELPDFARLAEELGYTDAWSMEVNGLDGFTPLAAVAAVTGLRVGTAIIPVFIRPPGLLAMHAAAMAELAPGRFVLGIGSSTPVVVEQWLGVPFAQPLTRTRETAVAVRALLAGERHGNMRLARPPAEPPAIYLAALGPKMLQSAGELADGVIFFLAGPRIIPDLLRQVGRELDSVARLVVIRGGSEEAVVAARRALTTYALVPFYARSLERQGFGEEVKAIQERWQAGDRAGAVGQVSGAMVAELLLVGEVDRIAEGLAAYRRAGLRTPVLAFSPVGPDPASRRAEVDLLLRELAGS
jgi:probable F420-dependent oxidoreductase